MSEEKSSDWHDGYIAGSEAQNSACQEFIIDPLMNQLACAKEKAIGCVNCPLEQASQAEMVAEEEVLDVFRLLSTEQRAKIRAKLKVATDRIIEWQEKMLGEEL